MDENKLATELEAAFKAATNMIDQERWRCVARKAVESVTGKKPPEPTPPHDPAVIKAVEPKTTPPPTPLPDAADADTETESKPFGKPDHKDTVHKSAHHR